MVLLRDLFYYNKFMYNKFPLQQEIQDVNTCGRWVIIHVSTFLKESMKNKQFLSFIKKTTKKGKTSARRSRVYVGLVII